MIAQSSTIRSTPPPRQWWLGAAVLFVAAVGVGILDSSAHRPLARPQSFFGSLLSPLARVGATIHGTSTDVWAAFFERDSLAQENERLRQEMAEMRLRDAIGTAQLTVAGARAALAPSLPPDTTLLDAAVLGIAPTSGRQLLWISRGSDEGVQPGMVVVGARGVVGTVQKVFSSTSLVTLIGDARSRWGAIGADSAETVVITGAGERGSADVLFSLSETQVRPGEMLLTSGQAGSSAPGGIPIGRLHEIATNRSGETVGILVPEEDPLASRVVFIMTARQLPSAPPAK